MNKQLICFIAFILLQANGFAQFTLTKQWDKDFGGNDIDILTSIIQCSDGGYILAGYSKSPASGDKSGGQRGTNDFWIVKTDANGTKLWDNTFGGDNYDNLNCIQQTTDGGYILGGSSSSSNSGEKTQPSVGNDYWIVKTDANGTKQWDKTFGGDVSDILYSVQQCSDQGYILGGVSRSGISGSKTQANNGLFDYWIVKTDSNGIQQWDKTFGGSSVEDFATVKQTADGGFILGGMSNSGISTDKTQASVSDDYWIVKTDANGTKQWDKTFGGNYSDILYSMQQCSDNGYILGGISESGISGDKTEASKGYWILKADSNGTKQWDKTFGGDDSTGEDLFTSIQQTLDGGYLLSGISYSDIGGDKTENNLGDEQGWFVKTDAKGTKQWDKTMRTDCGLQHDEYSFGIQEKDGCYLFGVSTTANPGGDKTENSQGDEDYWISKYCCDISYSVSPDVTIEAGHSAVIAVTGGEFYHWSPAENLDCPTCSSVTASPIKSTTYAVKISDNHGCSKVDSVHLTVFVDSIHLIVFNSAIIIPNIFTPNNDGANDKFLIPVSGFISINSTIIYNRWGIAIYENSNGNAWDGRLKNGELATDGVYFYGITTINKNMVKELYTGFLTLTR